MNKVTQIVKGRFHHFHLARQMEKYGLLNKIYSAYPRFKLKDELGIPLSKIKTFPWLHAPYMRRNILKLDKIDWLNKQWKWLDSESLDNFVKSQLKERGVLIGLSCNGLHSGRKMKDLGGSFICDRGSSHIVFQNELLNEEYQRWGFNWVGTDSRIINKELKEYQESDIITIPSEFVRRSFIEKGVDPGKLKKIPYGARLDRFKKVADPSNEVFRVLWVGGVSLRKGFMYALNAFQKLKHPKKEFVIIGAISSEIQILLENENLADIKFLGMVPNTDLLDFYSRASVFVIPSVEEGLAMVQGEALACGCPIISSWNAGADDLITHKEEGFIIPIRNSQSIIDSFYELLETPHLRSEMSEKALLRVKSIGGWDEYGANFNQLIKSLEN